MFNVKISDRNTKMNEGTLRRLKIVKDYFEVGVSQARRLDAIQNTALQVSAEPVILGMIRNRELTVMHKPRSESPPMDIPQNQRLTLKQNKSAFKPYKMRTEDLFIFEVEESLVQFMMPLIRLPLSIVKAQSVRFNEIRLTYPSFASTTSEPIIAPAAQNAADDQDQELEEIQDNLQFNLSL